MGNSFLKLAASAAVLGFGSFFALAFGDINERQGWIPVAETVTEVSFGCALLCAVFGLIAKIWEDDW